MSASRKKNQNSTPTRGATASSSKSSTFVRPTTTGGRKKEEQKKEEEAKTESRPTGRIDHPTTKYDYIEQMEQEEKKKEEGQRPSGRIDHPTGKYQYLEDDEKASAPVAADNSAVVVEYTLKVVSPGPNAEKVADLVLGNTWRVRNADAASSYSCTMGQAKAAEAFDMARQAVALGAKVEFKKRVLIEVTII